MVALLSLLIFIKKSLENTNINNEMILPAAYGATIELIESNWLCIPNSIFVPKLI